MTSQYDCNQLSNIIRKIENLGLDYWIDSGTLLGLIRDGDLLDGDKDIDIGVWSGEEKKIILAFNESFEEEYSLKEYFFRKALYKLKLIPINPNEKREIDINIFIKYQDSAWCFQSLFFKKTNKLSYYFLAMIEYTFTARYIRSLKSLFYGKFPLILLRRPGFWQVPIEHFEKTTSLAHKGMNIKVPGNTDKYLSLKYGDWRSPRSNWDFMVDDGLIKRKFPKILLEKL
mgnify:CR=1 FL=1